MLRAHVAAGLDPQAFWTLTPREWVTRMKGAEDRHEVTRVRSAISAWVGAKLDEKGLKAWIEAPVGRAARPLTPEGVERMLKHTVAGLPEMSLEQYRQMKGSKS